MTARRPVEAMLNALFISIHARFVREIGRLPEGVEVIVCSGGTAASRDYTDFSDTEALIAAGRVEALEVLGRYGVIDVPGPARQVGGGQEAVRRRSPRRRRFPVRWRRPDRRGRSGRWRDA